MKAPALILATAAGALCTGAADAGSSPRVIDVASVTYAASSRAAMPAPGLTPDKTPVRYVTELDRLYNIVPQFGKKKRVLIGTDRSILVHFASGRVWISVVAKFPGGTIYVRSDLKRGIARMDGGTGRYASARGTLEIRDLSVPSLAENIYRFAR